MVEHRSPKPGVAGSSPCHSCQLNQLLRQISGVTGQVFQAERQASSAGGAFSPLRNPISERNQTASATALLTCCIGFGAGRVGFVHSRMVRMGMDGFFNSLRPRPVISDRRHDREAAGSDQELRKNPVGSRLQNKGCEERKVIPTQNTSRGLLPAFDQRSAKIGRPAGPAQSARYAAAPRRMIRLGQMQETIGREIGLVVRIERRRASAGTSRRNPETCRPSS